ncbi:TPM domain-containing protein [Sphingomonas rosea]|uniref:TPM domain-containing protein n=1 Tax=Sphingomonas rosea TaxID=335605 RepID=A0ABP7TJE4_9SPHN
MVTLKLDDSDHQRVSEAIAAAEATSDGEILTIVSADSDSYHDVALHWAVAAMLGVIAVAAWQSDFLARMWDRLFGGWGVQPSIGQILFFVLILVVLKFLAVLLVMKWRPLRLALTPGATKGRRVRRRAIALFRAATERRTVGRTGVLIYLSLAERRAEIVADEAVTKVTTPECWGDAMSELIAEIRQGNPGEGLVLAVREVGEVLTRHFPKTGDDRNEIPDKLIEL